MQIESEYFKNIDNILRTGNYEAREEAIVKLREMKSDQTDILNILVNTIYNDPHGSIRILAAESLSRLNKCPQHALPVLEVALEVYLETNISKSTRNINGWTRVIIGAIGNFGINGQSSSDLLIRAMFECDMNISGYAVLSLAKIGAKEAIPAMKKLRDSQSIGELKQFIDKAINDLEAL